MTIDTMIIIGILAVACILIFALSRLLKENIFSDFFNSSTAVAFLITCLIFSIGICEVVLGMQTNIGIIDDLFSTLLIMPLGMALFGSIVWAAIVFIVEIILSTLLIRLIVTKIKRRRNA